MKTRLKNHDRAAMLLLCGGLLVAIAIVFFNRWQPHPPQAVSDGVLRDTGFWSYPRYHITFPPLEVISSAKKVYRLNSVPRELMTFQFNIIPNGTTLSTGEGLNDDWVFAVIIRDEGGAERHRVESPLSDWNVAQAVSFASIWHKSLRDLKFDPDQTYELEIQFTGPTGNSGVVVEPQLTGGGNEGF